MLGRTLIVCGGEINIEFVKSYLAQEHFDTVLCADSGLDKAYELDLPVRYFMGDFDSVNPDIKKLYIDQTASSRQKAEYIQYPKEKDATDTQIVLEWAVDGGATEIVLLGATGRRLDHFMANVNILMYALRAKIHAEIVDKYNKIYLMDGDYVISREKMYGKYISLQPLSTKVSGITLEGFYYPLENATMTIGSSQGVSNELKPGAKEGILHVKEGVLIVTESRDSWDKTEK